MKNRLLVLAMLFLIASCGAPAPTATRLPASTPPPISLSDVVATLAPDRPTIPRPSVVPLTMVTPLNPDAPGGYLVEDRFYSRLLGEQLPILLYLPPGYFESTRRYPVLYMLSGFSGDYREWATYGLGDVIDALIRGGQIPPMMIAMPEGAKSWWMNHAPPPASDGKRWGDYVVQEVVGFVDVNYRTLPRRASRAVGGLSAGGQSALMFALTHPEVFSVAGAHSPSLRTADGSVAAFGDEIYFRQYDPVWLLKNTTTWKQVAIWIDIANNDTQWGDAIHDFHKTLDALGVAHEFRDQWEGKHDSDYWATRLPDYLQWYSSKLVRE